MKLPALFAAVAALFLAQDPQLPRPTFKSTVDVVPVDVSIVDRTGMPVGDLKAGDFVLSVDGRPRKIAAAQFISIARHTTEDAPVPLDYASNTAAAGGRLIALVVDQGNISAGGGKRAIDAARRFISTLNPADRVALYAIPGAGPQLDFTAQHAVLQPLLDRIVGTATQGAGPHNIGVAEMFGLQRSDYRIITNLLDRECPGIRTPEEIAACQAQIAGEARALSSEINARTNDSLLALRQVMDRLAIVPGPKTVVLISEGFYIDRDVADLSWVAPAAARGQISLYVLQLEPAMFDASNPRISATRTADIDLAQDGLGYLTGLARGDVFRVTSGADFAFSRISRELSGFYLLSFEPEDADRDGRRHQIKITVPGRRDLLIRARSEFSITGSRTSSAADVLSEAIRSPLLATEIPLKLNVYNFWDPKVNKIKVIVAAQIDRTQNPGAALSAGYALYDAKGALVNGYTEPAADPVRADGTQPYTAAIHVDPGVHTLKLAVLDDAGKRGSVELSFDARLQSMGQIRAGDILLVTRENGKGKPNPSVDGIVSTDVLHAYVELYSEVPAQLADATVTMDVMPREGAKSAQSTAVMLTMKDAGTRVGETAVAIGQMPPGEYMLRAIVRVNGREAGSVSRPFRIAAK